MNGRKLYYHYWVKADNEGSGKNPLKGIIHTRADKLLSVHYHLLPYQGMSKAGSIENIEIPCLNHRLNGLMDDTDLETSGQAKNSLQSGQIAQSEKSVESVQSSESVIQTGVLKGYWQSGTGKMNMSNKG